MRGHLPDERAYVVGVVSRGDDCAGFNQPGIYTNVKEYLSWIEENSKDGHCWILCNILVDPGLYIKADSMYAIFGRFVLVIEWCVVL